MKRKYYLRGLGLGILVTALVFIFAGPKELSDEEIIKRAEKLGYVKEESSFLGIKDLLNKETPAPTKSAQTDKNSDAENTLIPTPTELPEKSPSPTLEPTLTPTSIVEPVLTATPTAAPTATVVPTIEPVPTATVVPTVTVTPTVEPKLTTAPIPTATPTPTVVPIIKSKSVFTNESGEVIKATIVIERGCTAKTVCDVLEEAGIIRSAEELRDYLAANNLTNQIIAETYHLSSDMSLEEIVKRLTDYYNYN